MMITNHNCQLVWNRQPHPRHYVTRQAAQPQLEWVSKLHNHDSNGS